MRTSGLTEPKIIARIIWIVFTAVLLVIPEIVVTYCVYKATGNSYLAVAALIVTGLINRPSKQ